ncbi:MAG: hypothetical protein WD768_23535 [Phycisphaeraceae bacterium]
MRRFPWYLVLPFAGACLAGGLFVVNVLMLMLTQKSEIFAAWNGLTRFVVLPLIIVSLLWLAWVFPMLASRDVTLRFALLPRQRLFILHVMIWSSALGLLIGAAFCLVVLPIATAIMSRGQGWIWAYEQQLGLWLLLILLPMAWWNRQLSQRVTKRFHETINRLQLCFNCKYDLRVNPKGPCPECGWLSEKQKSTKAEKQNIMRVTLR